MRPVRLEPFAIADERHLSFEDVERLIFEMVHVVRRSPARRNRQVLDERECSIGGFPSGANTYNPGTRTEASNAELTTQL